MPVLMEKNYVAAGDAWYSDTDGESGQWAYSSALECWQWELRISGLMGKAEDI